MRFFLAAVAVFSFFFSTAQDSLTLKGKLKGQGANKVYISLTDENGKAISCLAIANNDVFSVKIKKLPLPVVARLGSQAQQSLSKTENGKTYGSPAPQLFFFIYNADIEINGSVENLHTATVKGGKENDEFLKYKKSVEKIENRTWQITRSSFNLNAEKDSVEKSKFSAESSALFNKQKQLQKEFIKKNPSSFGSVFLLQRLENLFTAEDFAQEFENLGDKYKNTALAIQLKKKVDFISITTSGKPAIPFTRIDKDGNQISLSDFKGKIVLLDFWGSWCGPCRASHPHLKELYAKYKDKGFEIVAVAQQRFKTIEERKEKWLEAIEKDGIKWVHVMNDDGTEDKQDIVKDYRISAFPTKILLDKDGTILLRISASATDDIDKMLEKILGK